MNLVAADNPILHQICRADFLLTLDDIVQMFAVMRRHNGAGLAAPQVGINARLFITTWGQVFVNPEIFDTSSNEVLGDEGCLSLPGQVFRIARPEWIVLKTGECFSGIQARVILHELDHLNGKLISD